jgi:hypothetical protein
MLRASTRDPLFSAVRATLDVTASNMFMMRLDVAVVALRHHLFYACA